ncbi:MAG: hypothetical protein HY819_03620 [Acidobacteria bacterium]|nr:hypothetical protein [Acidobacteriota bacterium]
MANKIMLRKIILLITLTLALCYLTPTLLGCGPVFRTAVFTYSAHPDLPLEGFARGEIGVLKREYARSYLVVAYRYLSNEKLGPKEQKSVLNLWYDRLGEIAVTESSLKTFQIDDNIKEDEDEYTPTGHTGSWLEARKKVNPKDPEKYLSTNKNVSLPDVYTSYVNCKDDAFGSATMVLEEKIKTLGANHPEVQEWVLAQDQVFSNCSELGQVPAQLKPNSNQRAKADRAYQIAAAKFYREEFDEAANLFKQISNDKNSPWQKIAPYLVARCLVRKSMLSPPPSKDISFQGYFDRTIMLQAETQIKNVLSNPALEEYHPAARRLNRYINFHLDPTKRFSKLVEELTKRDGVSFKQDLDEYTTLLDKLSDDLYDYELPNAVIVKRLPEVLGKQDLTDWILNFQLDTPESLDYSLKKWDEKQSTPWLVSALSKINSKHKKVPELLAASDKIIMDSPAFPTIIFHKVRLLKEAGKNTEALTELDKVLNADIPISGRNELYSQRMILSSNLEEFLKYAQRTAAGEGYFYDNREVPDLYEETEKKEPKPKILFDFDSTLIINKYFPLSLMKEAAFNKDIPAHLRKRLVMATWVRAVMLENDEIGKASAQELGKLIPELKEGLGDYLNATTPQAKKFAGLFLVLRFPVTRPIIEANLDREDEIDKINSYRDNWWCSFDPTDVTSSIYSRVERDSEGNPKPQKEEIPTFLTKTLLSQAQAEQTKLAALGTAPNYLCDEIVKWAKANLSDPRVPESLHLAVKSTRYGCVDKKTLAFSKSAFQVLHKNFPNNAWTKKTPYFFGDQ